MSTYNQLKFVLIGDSGQKDAEVYQQIAQEFPGRVVAIYIREVRKSREQKVQYIGSSLKKEGVEMLLIKDTIYAARHAIKNGLITPQSLSDVIHEKKLDRQSTMKI